jgi:hypothetical protein
MVHEVEASNEMSASLALYPHGACLSKGRISGLAYFRTYVATMD